MNCKQGDMAFLVRAVLPENLGRVFEVLEPIGYFDRREFFTYRGRKCIAEFPGFYWWARTSKLANRPLLDGSLMASHDGHVADIALRPIRPDGITTEEVKELFSPSPAKESEKV